MEERYKKSKSFLGTGWSFPPTFHDRHWMGIELVENEHDIKESLQILLNTNLGERIMLPDYGSELQQYLFQPITNSRKHYIKDIIRSAIIKYEPRIKVNDVIIDQHDYLEGMIRVNIKYTIKSNNTRFNLVFPYYKMEGTNIPVLYLKHVTQTAINN